MTDDGSISVGIVGTSWWVDAMYLPALAAHPRARVTAICGRTSETTRQMADRWQIPRTYAEYAALLDDDDLDAVIVATRNDSHYPITMRALEAGKHVLCEKPLALRYAQARQMAEFADQQGVKHMVPFTYRYMPTTRYLKELIEGGYIGRPYHLNLRYYTGYGRDGRYLWRFDTGKAGSGAVGDIGSHFLHLAEWLFGPITALTCQLGRMVPRPPLDPDGAPYQQADDTALLLLVFANGAHGVIHASTVAYEDTHFGQTHHMEFHGSGGTLYSVTDWDRVQRVSGARKGEGAVRELPIPDHIWGGARRDTVHNTYRDVFRTQHWMARAFITAIADDRPLSPSFHEGARVQRLIEAALLSDRSQAQVLVESIV
jgi:predicted dehydrogenase